MAGQELLTRMACPFCCSVDSGRYHQSEERFLCLNAECPRYAQRVSYSEFLQEVERLQESFFTRFPALTDGTSRTEALAITEELLSKGVNARLAGTLLYAWNETKAAPPVPIVRIPAHLEHRFRWNVNTDSSDVEHRFR